jgi:hypothetical protein
MAVISESGLYKLIMRCDKPEARGFQDWVSQDVLPSIRETGSYIKGEETFTGPCPDRYTHPENAPAGGTTACAIGEPFRPEKRLWNNGLCRSLFCMNARGRLKRSRIVPLQAGGGCESVTRAAHEKDMGHTVNFPERGKFRPQPPSGPLHAPFALPSGPVS